MRGRSGNGRSCRVPDRAGLSYAAGCLCNVGVAVRDAEGFIVCCGDGAFDGGAVLPHHGASRADPGRLADDAAPPGPAARSSASGARRHAADPAASAAEGHAAGGAAPAGPPAFRREGAILSRGASEAGIDRPLIDRAGIEAAERLIRPYIRRTPVIRVEAGDLGVSGEPLVLKLEFLQHTGSFKPRGAFASLLSRPAPPAGVVAASGGNHGAAVAYAAMRLGIRATIFVPQVTAPAKLERIRGYGAELIVSGALYADALRASHDFAERHGALQIHAYDQPETLLGQGTVGCEIAADAPEIDTLLVAAGGGGLIGGIAAWYQGRIRLVAVEPEGAPTLHNALAAGHPVDAPAGGIAADSLAPARVGTLMFPLAQRFVERAVLVEDAAIRDAQRRLWSALRIAAEPGGAAAMAALISGRYRPVPGERIGVVLCGANTDAIDFDRAGG